jgi:hypothetical protein
MTSNVTYVRWQRDEPREGRVFRPLNTSHPAYGAGCWLCGEKLGNGAQVQPLALGPEDSEDRAKHHEGRWWSCTGM